MDLGVVKLNVQDVIKSEYLRVKGNGYSKGMRWSQDTKDLFVSQKIVGGSRQHRTLRQNVGGPSITTVSFVLHTYTCALIVFVCAGTSSRIQVPCKNEIWFKAVLFEF